MGAVVSGSSAQPRREMVVGVVEIASSTPTGAALLTVTSAQPSTTSAPEPRLTAVTHTTCLPLAAVIRASKPWRDPTP